MAVLRLLLLAVLVKSVILDNPLDFMNEKQKGNLGTLKLSSLPDSEHRVLREVILHGNATYVYIFSIFFFLANFIPIPLKTW